MSLLQLTCPWCGEDYSYGLVGKARIGPNHHCQVDVECQEDGCERPSKWYVADDDGFAFACSEHVGDRTVYRVHTSDSSR